MEINVGNIKERKVNELHGYQGKANKIIRLLSCTVFYNVTVIIYNVYHV